MTEMNTKLVAIEEETLETVAGGAIDIKALKSKVKASVTVNKVKQENFANISDNLMVSLYGGDVFNNITQSIG